MRSEKQRQARFKKRLRLWHELFKWGLSNYEKKCPNWQAQTVLDVILQGIQNLRKYIEMGDPEISWELPISTIQFPVEWDWKVWQEGSKDKPPLMITPLITEESLKTKERIIKSVAEAAVAYRNQHVLSILTRHVGYEKRDGKTTRIMSRNLIESLRCLRAHEQRFIVEDLYKPFNVGAVEVEIDDKTLSGKLPLPQAMADQIAAEMSCLDLPELTFHGYNPITKELFKVSIIAKFEPLAVDVDEKRAYFPVTVGIVFRPQPDDHGKPVLPDLAKWKPADRQHFWDKVEQALRQLSAGFNVKVGAEGPPPHPTPTPQHLQMTLAPFEEGKNVAILSDVMRVVESHGKLVDIAMEPKPLDQHSGGEGAREIISVAQVEDEYDVEHSTVLKRCPGWKEKGLAWKDKLTGDWRIRRSAVEATGWSKIEKEQAGNSEQATSATFGVKSTGASRTALECANCGCEEPFDPDRMHQPCSKCVNGTMRLKGRRQTA